MELEQLKNIWQKTSMLEQKDHHVSPEQVQTLIKKRSNMAVAKIKRRVRNKFFIAGTIGISMILGSVFVLKGDEPAVSFLRSKYDMEIGVLYLVFGLVICFISVFNGLSYKKIQKTEKREADLKTSIQSILSILRKAINVKIYSDVLAVPLTALSLIILNFIGQTSLFPNSMLLIIVAGAIAFAAFSYFVAKYGQKRRYGRLIAELEECLQELEDKSI